MSPIKTAFSLVFALLITGCASSPTQFASPDVENGTYTIGEGETLKLKKPDTRTIGFQDYNDAPNFYEIIDFKASPYTEGGYQIPDSHMIGVRAADPENGGEIVIPLQYVEKLKGSKDDWYVEHSISGVKSPLPILVLKKNGFKVDELFWHFNPQGQAINPVFIFQTNSDPFRSIREMHDGNLIEEYVHRKWGYYTYTFFHGEAFDQAFADFKVLTKKRWDEHEKIQEKAKQMSESRERRYKLALNAPKSVGEMVCSTDSYLGNVEQIAGDRVKVRIIGLMAMPSEWLIGDDNYDFNFDIDSRDEGKIRWFDSNKVGACDITVTRG